MRRKFIYLLSLCLLLLTSCEKEQEIKTNRPDLGPDELKIMSFNMREPADGGKDEWAVRAGAVMAMFDDQQASLMGFQEAGHESINRYLKAIIPSHGYVFVDELENKNSMAYRPELLKVVKKGLIWLTDTPSVPSLSTSGYVRTARWVIFEIVATGTQFFFINTHFDLSSTDQKANLRYINKLIAQQNKDNLPVVMTGDFNVESYTSVFDSIQETMVSTRDVAPVTDSLMTYNAWGNTSKQRIIDHIFMSKELECSEYKTVTQSYENHYYVSDHYPVYSIINFDNHE